MSSRAKQVASFLEGTSWAGSEPVFLAGDASARTYYRILGPRNAVLMDAPPSSNQDISVFAGLARFLDESGLSAPQIYAEDRGSGLLLIEDFGDDVFARLIESDPAKEMPLYQAATGVLAKLAETDPPPALQPCGASELAAMVGPAFDWYRWAVTGEAGDAKEVMRHLEETLSPYPPNVLSLRDFHAENLIWLPDREGPKAVGLLDFQDAFVTIDGYDLVSLLLDARRDVSSDVIETVQSEYAQIRGLDPNLLSSITSALGTQRNLRILGVFTRLALKFDKPRYLDFIPRVWRYVETCVAHPTLPGLAAAVQRDLPAPSPALIKDLRSRCGTVPDR
jgi:aminoglycoside/choline kinase family phosphotransferase